MRSVKVNFLSVVFLLFIMVSCGNEPGPVQEKSEEKRALDPEVSVMQKMDSVFSGDGKTLSRVSQSYSNDSIFREWNYENGRLNGESYSYYPDGKPYSMHTYVNGKKQGAYRLWHPNGQLYTDGQWKDDVPTGIWKFYDESGKLKTEVDADKEPVFLEPDTLGSRQ